MKKLCLIALVLLAAMGMASPASARHGGGGVSIYANFGYPGGYYPYYPAYPAYYSPYYVAPPPVVYTVPPAAPVIYAEPEPIYVVPSSVAANQTSPTYMDEIGRTCRNFEATSPGGPPYGKACLQPDGSWRTVP